LTAYVIRIEVHFTGETVKGTDMNQMCLIFGADKTETCSRATGLYFEPPEELRSIKRGAYSEFVGLSINEGLASWVGFDLDRCEAVMVRYFGGENIDYAPKTPDGPTRTRRQLDNGASLEVITRMLLEQAKLIELVNLANGLWSANNYWNEMATDIHNAIVLLDGDTAKELGGPGLLVGGAAQLKSALEGLFSAGQ
jgi:hypothetical protein